MGTWEAEVWQTLSHRINDLDHKRISNLGGMQGEHLMKTFALRED